MISIKLRHDCCQVETKRGEEKNLLRSLVTDVTQTYKVSVSLPD